MSYKQIIVRGTKQEQKLFYEVNQHYEMADNDNRNRWADWDSRYELFRNYIDENSWPYNALIFVPQTFTALFEKMARLNGGKPRGRLIPRRDGTIIGAKVNNELLNFQWDEVSRKEGEPMTAKWSLMDLQTRIYGGSFGVVQWRYEEDKKGNVIFDGPTFRVLDPKNSLPNPSYSTVKNWFQYRDYPTIGELERVNNVTGRKPKYKNLAELKKAIEERSRSGGDRRDTEYTPRGKEIQGLTDYLGADESPDFKTVEIVTELRDDREIVFAPKHGIILRDEPNPYDHSQIPVVQLKYISIDDDTWGLSEIEPVEKVQKALNALSSQFVDAMNMDLYRIVKVRANKVQMHTLEFGPGKKWIMNDPDDVVPLEHSGTATNQFVNVYSVLTAMFKEALGETSAAFSSLEPFGTEKTATEIQASQLTKTVRDNFNQIFLGESIQRMTMFWLLMNKQFVFADGSLTVPLRILGRETISEFQNLGLDEFLPAASEEEVVAASLGVEDGIPGELDEVPAYPVHTKEGVKPKFQLEEGGEFGTLHITPDDMTGNYDYIVDVEPMRVASTFEEQRLKREMVGLLQNPNVVQLLAQEKKTVKISEVLLDLFDSVGVKNSEKYFDTLEEQDVGINPAGNAQGQGGGGNGAPQANIGLGDTGANAAPNQAQLGGPQAI